MGMGMAWAWAEVFTFQPLKSALRGEEKSILLECHVAMNGCLRNTQVPVGPPRDDGDVHVTWDPAGTSICNLDGPNCVPPHDLSRSPHETKQQNVKS